jgi:transposase
LLGPARPDVTWQAQTENAFDRTDFSLDFQQRTATCPQGHTTHQWYERSGRRGKPTLQVRFPATLCNVCPVHTRCTTAKNGRQLTFAPEAQFRALLAARQREQSATFKVDYKKRAGIEGTLSYAVGVLGMRHTRYRGMTKVHLQHLMTAASLNLLRVLDWLWGKPRATTRTSAFARLAVA